MRRRAVGGASGGRGRHVSPFLLDKLTARISQVVMESFKNTFTVFEEILVGGDEGARESRFGRGQETDGWGAGWPRGGAPLSVMGFHCIPKREGWAHAHLMVLSGVSARTGPGVA